MKAMHHHRWNYWGYAKPVWHKGEREWLSFKDELSIDICECGTYGTKVNDHRILLEKIR
jgi:hypothetical protein